MLGLCCAATRRLNSCIDWATCSTGESSTQGGERKKSLHLIYVALSGRPGQVGAWARIIDRKVSSDEARTLAQHQLFVRWCRPLSTLVAEAGEAKLSCLRVD